MTWTILQGDALHIPLADGAVQCVVTSPPYWGLRSYGHYEMQRLWGDMADFCPSRKHLERWRARYGWAGRTEDGSGGARTGGTFRRMAASGEPIATIPADGGRNARTVWAIPTVGLGGAHFATFPPALVEPCVRAGTSERGCCPRCHAPWERVVERQDNRHWSERRAERKKWGLGTNPGGRNDGGGSFFGNDAISLGWQPTCKCNAGTPVPCIVLDQFGGAGTTVLVADRLGRHGVALELKREYAAMAHRRVYDDAPLFAAVGY